MGLAVCQVPFLFADFKFVLTYLLNLDNLRNLLL